MSDRVTELLDELSEIISSNDSIGNNYEILRRLNLMVSKDKKHRIVNHPDYNPRGYINQETLDYMVDKVVEGLSAGDAVTCYALEHGDNCWDYIKLPHKTSILNSLISKSLKRHSSLTRVIRERNFAYMSDFKAFDNPFAFLTRLENSIKAYRYSNRVIKLEESNSKIEGILLVMDYRLSKLESEQVVGQMTTVDKVSIMLASGMSNSDIANIIGTTRQNVARIKSTAKFKRFTERSNQEGTVEWEVLNNDSNKSLKL